MRVSRLAEDHYLLDVEAGFGAQVVARLTRFLLRTDCSVEEVEWDLVTVIDAEASGFSPPVGGLALPVEWPGLVAIDLLGPSVELPDGLAEGSPQDWEARRIAAGIPAMGSEMDSTTIPAATGVVDRSASFTKGCYTGQELVARVNSRPAGTPTRIVRASGSGPAPPVGSEVTVDSDPAGHLRPRRPLRRRWTPAARRPGRRRGHRPAPGPGCRGPAPGPGPQRWRVPSGSGAPHVLLRFGSRCPGAGWGLGWCGPGSAAPRGR